MTQRIVNYKYSTGNPVLPDGSIDVRDGADNLQSFDVFMNATEDEYNQRDGVISPTVRGAIKALGPVVTAWTFTTGGTLNYPNEAMLNSTDGNYYSWAGVFPHVVEPGADPTLPGSGYVPRTDVLLRSELSSDAGATFIGYSGTTVSSVLHTVSMLRYLSVASSHTAAFQMAVDDQPDLQHPIEVNVPTGEYDVSGVVIPRRGVVLNMCGALIRASSGVVFAREFQQIRYQSFVNTYNPLSGNVYFRPITINGGTVKLSGDATFISIRQPFLYAKGQQNNTLIMNGTDIEVLGDSKAFGIHGGWGFVFNHVTVHGDSDTASGTALYSRPDGSYFSSSHPQVLHFNNCQLNLCRAFDMLRGSCTNSCEDLQLSHSVVGFGEFGVIDRPNALNIVSSMIITNRGDGFINDPGNMQIIGGLLQRYHNSPTDTRYGVLTVRGSASSVKIGGALHCSLFAPDSSPLYGSALTFVVNDGEQLLGVDIDGVTALGSANLDMSTTNTTLQSSVVRCIQTGTGSVRAFNCRNISGRGIRNLVDIGDFSDPSKLLSVQMRNITGIGASVQRRVRGLSNAQVIDAPEMYLKATVKAKAAATNMGTKSVASYTNLATSISGTISASASSFTSISNAAEMYYDGAGGGVVRVALVQSAGLTAGAPVEAQSIFTFDASGSLQAQ